MQNALTGMVLDFFAAPTKREDARGADFRSAVAEINTEWPNPEVAPSPDEDLAYVEAINEPDARRAPVEKFDAQETHYEIRRLSVEIKSLEYERDQFEAKITERIDRRKALRERWMKETEKLSCFELLESMALPPALPQTEGE